MKNYKLLLIVFLSALIIQLAPISALGPVGEKGITVQIINGELVIQGYTIVQDPSTGLSIKAVSDNLFINKAVSQPISTIVCNSVDVPMVTVNTTWNGTTQPVTPSGIFNTNYSRDIPFIGQNTTNTSSYSLFCISQEKYESCLNDKNLIEGNYRALVEINAKSNTTNLECNAAYTNLGTCQSEKSTIQAQVTTLTDEKEKTKNQKWVYGLVGLAAGIFGTLWSKGFIGKPKVRDPGESYNRGQAA